MTKMALRQAKTAMTTIPQFIPAARRSATTAKMTTVMAVLTNPTVFAKTEPNASVAKQKANVPKVSKPVRQASGASVKAPKDLNLRSATAKTTTVTASSTMTYPTVASQEPVNVAEIAMLVNVNKEPKNV